jgi:S-adenosylmethionine synthetase
VAGEVTTQTYRHPRHHQGQDPRDRVWLLGQGLRRRLLRRVGLDRLPVAGHRPGVNDAFEYREGEGPTSL